MTIICTVSGREINYIAPDPEQINLDDLAMGLSRQPRYTGQTIWPYSVAQHCLLVAELVDEPHRLHALLHDAPEAYLCDVPSPAKEAMRVIAMHAHLPSGYDVIEQGLWKAICRRFGLDAELPAEVARADREALKVEAPRLQPLGWKHAHWDAYRREPPPAIPEWRVDDILDLENGGRYAWASAVSAALERR